MNIVFLQQTFFPGGDMSDLSIASIKSFYDYITKYYPTTPVRFVLGGWAANSEEWDKLTGVAFRKPENCKLYLKRFDHNFGKAYIVNNLFGEQNFFIEDFFLTADSDIRFDLNVPNIFDRLTEGTERLAGILKAPCGVLAANMTEGNCHLFNEVDHEFFWDSEKYGQESLLTMKGVGGIAGGCLYVSRSAFADVQGYQVRSVYGPDDARLFPDMYRKGYCFGIMKSVTVIHPESSLTRSGSHNHWKVTNAQGADKATFNKPFEESVAEAELYWKELCSGKPGEPSG